MLAHAPDRRWWDWPAALLLMIAILTAASRLVATEWTPHLSLAQTVAFFGILAGLALGISRFSSSTVGLFAFVYGAFTVSWQLGNTLEEEFLWLDRSLILLRRLGVVIYQLLNRQNVTDSLLFIVLMNVLFWILAVYAGYILGRYGDAWKAILPTGLALFVIQYYDPLLTRRTWYLAFFIFFALILVARMAFVNHRLRWKDTRTTLPPHLSLDFIRFTVLFAGLIVLLAWTAPALANALPAAERLWRPMRSAWNDSLDRFNYAFASLRTTMPTISPIYGSSSALGSGNRLGNTQVFVAHAPDDTPAGVRFYWRARTFDQYQDGEWFSNITTNYHYTPEDNALIVPQGLGRWVGEFRIVSAVVMGTLFTPSQPLWVNQEGLVIYARNSDGTADINTFISDPTVLPSQSYQTSASLSAPTVEQMQLAGSDYPDYITERYLQLPSNLTPRTRELAQTITAGLETPYDKVQAITNYLRENMEYVQVLESPIPANQEPIDWFLFDGKQGFCNYYATAEVMLLRSLGIPARWSIGYAQGELASDEDPNTPRQEGALTYIVRQKDAHAWPEVYFPTIGWVEFEPTASQPNIARLQDQDLSRPLRDPQREVFPDEDPRDRDLGDENAPPATPAVSTGERLRVLGMWLAGITASVLLLLLAVWWLLPRLGLPGMPVLFERGLTRLGLHAPEKVRHMARQAEAQAAERDLRWPPLPVMLQAGLLRLGLRAPNWLRLWAGHVQLPPMTQAYTEINRSLARMGQPAGVTATPSERAIALSQELPAAHDPAHALVHEYQLSTFSRTPANLETARQSAQTLRSLSIRAWFNRLLSRFQSPAERRIDYRRKLK